MIEPHIVFELYSLFADKEWNKINEHKIVFKRFCELAEHLKVEQMELVLDLAKRYKWVTLNEYLSILINLVSQIIADYNSIKKFYLFPIIKPEDEDKNKSGNVIAYKIRSAVTFIEEFGNKKLKELTKFEELKEGNLKLKSNEILLLVDDYVGSGETLKAALTEIQKNPHIDDSKIVVLSLMMQKVSYDFLNSKNIKAYVHEIRSKGITQHYIGNDLIKNTRLMLEIESNIPGSNHFKFGYEGSEALTTLIRTPDNTFPVFWMDYKKRGKKVKPPFARY